MGEQNQKTDLNWLDNFQPPNIDAQTHSLRTFLENTDGEISTKKLNDALYQDDVTLELRILVLDLYDGEPENFEEKLKSCLNRGANPYALFSDDLIAESVLLSPKVMEAVIKTGVDMSLVKQFYEDNLPNTVFQDVIHSQSAAFIDKGGLQKKWDNYAKSQEILIKAYPELKPDMDAFLKNPRNNLYFENDYQNHTTYMLHRDLLKTCQEHGVFSEDEIEKFLIKFDMHHPADPNINVQDYHDKKFDGLRAGQAQYPVKNGDNISDIAQRYLPYSESPNTYNLAAKIIEQNDLNGDFIQPGQVLTIPVKHDAHFISGWLGKGDNMTVFANIYQPHIHSSTGNPYLDAKKIMKINGMEEDQIIHHEQKFHVPINEEFNTVASLNLPSNKKVTLAILEDGQKHHKNTFETASKLDYFRSTNDSDVIAINTSNENASQQQLMQLYRSSAVQNGNVIFSMSYAQRIFSKELKDIEPQYDKADYLYSEKDKYDVQFFEENQIIHFAAAGNEHDGYPNLFTALPSTTSIHGVSVGAIHEENGIKYIAGYSSIGADICAGPIHNINSNSVAGTSFSTPDFSDLYKNMAEAYGNVLTHEEIMVSAFYATDFKVKEFDPHKTPEFDLYYNDITARLEYLDDENRLVTGITSGSLKKGAVDQLNWAKFEINAAGIPHHPRAGAGMIDEQRWIENLDRMKTLKLATNNESDIVKQQTHLKDIDPDVAIENGKVIYTYKIPITSDMTLGKISMTLPQEQYHRSRAFLEGPSGTEMYMPYLNNAMFSTFLLACEDVKEGDFIKIKSEEPFTDEANIIIHGFEPGNTIEAFRDYAIQNNIAQTPNSVYQEQDNVSTATFINITAPEIVNEQTIATTTSTRI
jgi:LysM repeat protein